MDRRGTVAGTMKIADAIIVPALIMTASNKPSSRLRSTLVDVGSGDVIVFPNDDACRTRPQLEGSVRNHLKDKIQE